MDLPSPKKHSSLPAWLGSPSELVLEAAAAAAHNLLRGLDDKYDFESLEGQAAAQEYLKLLEKLCSVLQVATCNRAYREEFTQAYRVLYKTGKLGYLSEIIDSAQEQIPHLWVNGEKYLFSAEVLQAGNELYACFNAVKAALDAYSLAPTVVEEATEEVQVLLEHFDKAWTRYERMYVLELIVIEFIQQRPHGCKFVFQ